MVMTTPTLDALFDAAHTLPLAERLALASRLLQGAAQSRPLRTRRLPDPQPDLDPTARPGRGRISASTRTLADRHALYAAPVWASIYRPGPELHVYMLGCEQTGVLAALLGQPIFKVGTALMGRLDRRVAELNRVRYGSVARYVDGYRQEPGFDRWTAPTKLQLSPPHPLGPVRAGSSTFIVRLPDGLSPNEFESDLNRALRSASLRGYIDSDEGRATLAERLLDPDLFLRASLDRSTGLPVAATELMLIRPQADGPALAALLENIVIDHVLGVRMKRAA